MKIDITEQNILFDNFFEVEAARLRYEKFNGEMSDEMTYFSLNRKDGAASVVYNTDTQKVLLIKQFRYPPHRKSDAWMLEIVAGMIDEGETPRAAVKREIMEEIGYEVDYIKEISLIFTSPGISSERIFLFYAEVSSKGNRGVGGGLDNENEDILMLEYTLEELDKSLKNNKIQDAKTIIACQYLLSSHSSY